MTIRNYLPICLVMATAGVARGQTLSASEGLVPPGMKAGPVNGSYQLTGFESMNLFNGKANFAFPLLESTGRGEAGYTVTVPIESTNWQVVQTAPNVKYVEPVWDEAPPAGLGPGYLHRRSIGIVGSCPNPSFTLVSSSFTTYVLSRPGGGSLEFFPRDNPSIKTWLPCDLNQPDYTRGTVFVTRDGSAATLVLSTGPLESAHALDDGYKGGGEPTGYVIFKHGLRYNIDQGEVKSIVDRNGNKTVLEYHPSPQAPRSVILNAPGTGQSFDVNLPATITGSNMAQRTALRVEVRFHNFQPPTSGASSIIWSSSNGTGPILRMRNGALEAVLTETGATAGCSVPLGTRADIVARFQRETNGQYRLSAWDYSHDPIAPFATASCPLGQNSSINVSGLMSIGSDAGRTNTALYRGRLAYLRVYASTTSTTVQPLDQVTDNPLLYYGLDSIPQNYTIDTMGAAHLTAYGILTSEPSPGESAPGAGVIKKITDSIGREIDFSAVQETPAGSSIYLQTVTYKGQSGNPRTITIRAGLMSTVLRSGAIGTIGTLFNSGYTNAADQYNPVKVTHLGLPDGREYAFRYNQCGEVAEVTLPTGGRYEYDWDGVAGEATLVCKGQSPTVGGIQRFVKSRRMYGSGGSLEGSTDYTRHSTACNDCSGLPVNNAVVSVFHKNGGGQNVRIERHVFWDSPAIWRGTLTFPGWKEGKEYRSEVFKDSVSDPTVLTNPTDNYQRVTQTWKQYSAGGSTVPTYLASEDRPRVTEAVTELKEAGTAKSRTDTFEYDQYNNLLSSTESDWGGTALRQRTITYVASLNGYNYDTDNAIHLRNLPLIETIKTGGGTTEAITENYYDEYSQSGLSIMARSNATGRETGYGTSYTPRGNRTRLRRLRSAGVYLETKQRFDELGNAVEIWDGRQKKTTLDYADVFLSGTGPTSGTTYGFVTKVTLPPPVDTNTETYELSGTYDRFVGRLSSATDLNGIQSSYQYADLLDRPTLFTRLNASETFSYPNFTTVTSAVKQDSCGASSQSVTRTELFDGFGRPAKTSLAEGSGVTIDTATRYDGLGRVFEQDFPYRSSGSAGGKTETAFDWLGRVLTVTSPGTAVKRYGYRVNETWMRDEAGKWSRTQADGLGRLTEVTEDPVVTDNTIIAGFTNNGTSPAPKNYLTRYFYDTLNNLKTVSPQGVGAGVLERTFNYNSVGWLTSAVNPETGTISYGYDDNGNLTSRSDQRGASVTIGYDNWNRVKSKTYTVGSAEATSNVSYTYDAHTVTPPGTSYPKGRLTEIAVAGTGGTKTRYDQYDGLGRVLKSTQVTDNVDYAMSYTYNAAGGVESVTYPNSNRVVFTCYDQAGRVQSVRKDSATGTDIYAQVAAGVDPEGGAALNGYHALGGMERLLLESGKITRKWTYNARGQMEVAGVWSTPPSAAVSGRMKLTLGYGSAASNNGNVATQTIAVGGSAFTAVQSYGYDALNRLTSVVEGATNWKQGFGYDRWGNRWIETANTSGINVASGTPIGADWYDGNTKNQLDGVSYDDAGNGSPIPGKTFKYDVENRLVGVVATASLNETMVYDGEGRRVKRVTGSPAVTTTYVYL